MPDGCKLKILGARGSIPVQGEEYLKFGGATTCYLLKTDTQALFIDAGTGITLADPAELEGLEISVLLTHPHLDHLAGLPFFPLLMEKGRSVDIYGVDRGGCTVQEQIDALYRPPYWPCGLADYPAEIKYHSISYHAISYQPQFNSTDVLSAWKEETLQIGAFAIESMEVPHPGGCTAFRISAGGEELAVVTDAELPVPYEAVRREAAVDDTTAFTQVLASFIADADLMLCDSQYTAEEAKNRRGYGHSTPETAIAWQEAAGIRELVLVHHDPKHTDSFLSEYEQRIGRADVHFARAGEVFDWTGKL